MNLTDITPVILTLNEAMNLARTLAGVRWAQQILVVDSGSSDETAEISSNVAEVKFVERPFDSHTGQWNFGLEQVATEWTLALDADYMCSPALRDELESLDPQSDAYAADFVYAIHGAPLRGTLYPRRVALFRTGRFRYVQDGHTQLLDLAGAPCGRLRAKITHDDRKPLARWLQSQAAYAAMEAEKLMATPTERLGWKDRLRRGVVWAPPLMFAYCLFWKRLILDGWPGVYYALQRTYAELLLSLELLDRKLGRRSLPPGESAEWRRSEGVVVPETAAPAKLR